MSLQFIIGRSGSGKSVALYEKVIRDSMEHPDQKYLLIVPDQFTMDVQKTIITMHPRHGSMNIDIISFFRLAFRVFQELQLKTGVILEDLGKSMVISKILGEKQKELSLFRGSRTKMGFIDELKSLLSEFYQYGVTPELLEEQLEEEKEDTLLHKKLSELLLLMQEFEKFTGQDYIIAEQLLSVLGEHVEESELLRDSIICLDGFAGFTPVQYDLIRKLLLVCRKMYVTVTIDENRVQFKRILDYELFASSKEVLFKFRKIAEENQIKIEENQIIRTGMGKKSRFSDNPELSHLERYLFQPGGISYEKETERLTVHQLLNPEKEALFIAETISALVREKGYRYREIAVISGDTERYGTRLARIFEDYKIPYFLDHTTGIRNHPLAECIRGLFALSEYDYNYESICHYAKNGMTDIPGEEADALDNYLLATGIRGFSALSKEFTRKPRKISEHIRELAEQGRKRLMEETGKVMEVFRKKKNNVKDTLTALFFYMQEMQYEEKLDAEVSRFEEENNYVMMRAYSQVYDAVLELLDKIVDILGEEEMELPELRKILDAGLDEMQLGVIPPGIDQVIVGDTERTRLEHVKVLFFAGVNEGIIPKPAAGGGILSEMDREKLKKREFQLAPGMRQSTAMEQFYLYLNMTKPEDYLYLTFSLVDQEGKSIRPSYLVGRLKLLFPKLTIKGEGETEKKQEFYTVKAALPYMKEAMDRWMDECETEEDRAFLKWLFQSEDGKRWIDLALSGRFYSNEASPISREAAEAIYGLHMEASVTRLEKYAGCAFAHFLKYGLMLAERARYQLRSADLGQVLHRCLELFSREAEKEPGGFRNLPDEMRDALVTDCLRKAVEESGSSIFHSSARNEACIDRMERLSKRTVWALQKQLCAGDFEPGDFEWKFQSKKNLEAVTLQLEHGGSLELMGAIDRIDYYEEDEDLFVKIIDYKSGVQSFQLEDIYHGLQLQLVVYMNAAMEKVKQEKQKEVVPGGIFYFHIQDPIVEEKEGVSLEEEMYKEFSLSGLALAERGVIEHLDHEDQETLPVSFLKNGNFSARSSVATREQFENLGGYVKKKLKQYGQEILDGNIAMKPYKTDKKTACDYCEYRGVCGFDPSLSGNSYRRFYGEKKEDLWNKFEEERG